MASLRGHAFHRGDLKAPVRLAPGGGTAGWAATRSPSAAAPSMVNDKDRQVRSARRFGMASSTAPRPSAPRTMASAAYSPPNCSKSLRWVRRSSVNSLPAFRWRSQSRTWQMKVIELPPDLPSETLS